MSGHRGRVCDVTFTVSTVTLQPFQWNVDFRARGPTVKKSIAKATILAPTAGFSVPDVHRGQAAPYIRAHPATPGHVIWTQLAADS